MFELPAGLANFVIRQRDFVIRAFPMVHHRMLEVAGGNVPRSEGDLGLQAVNLCIDLFNALLALPAGLANFVIRKRDFVISSISIRK